MELWFTQVSREIGQIGSNMATQQGWQCPLLGSPAGFKGEDKMVQ